MINAVTFGSHILINVFMMFGLCGFLSMIRRTLRLRLPIMPAWGSGILFGVLALLSMLVPCVTSPGVMFDCRSGIMGAGALLYGPSCAIISILFPSLYRLHLGGPGMVPGLLEILVPALLGSLWHCLRPGRDRPMNIPGVILGSVLVGVCTTAVIIGVILNFMPQPEILLSTAQKLLLIIYGPASTALFASLILFDRRYTESLELHSSILQTAMEGFLLVDSGGRILDVNDAYCRMCGFTAAELRDRSIAEQEAAMTVEQVRQTIQEVNRSGYAQFETRHRRKDGSSFSVEVSVQVLRDGSGRFVSFLHDITERKASEAALLNSERKYKLLIETTQTGFVILDTAGRVLDANSEYVRMTGHTRIEEIKGRPVTDWTSPSDRERNAHAVETCLRVGSIHNLEINYRGNQGTVVPVEVHASVLQGDSICIMSICRDISERHRAIEERERLQSQLLQSQKLEALGRLAGGVSHDLNNMLGVILGVCELARHGDSPAGEYESYFEQIRTAGERSANLTRQLLAFARCQAAKPKVMNLNDTVEPMLKMLRRLIGENIELVWKPSPCLDTILMDPAQVDQILANLCINARDAVGTANGRICIETAMTTLDRRSSTSARGLPAGRYVLLAVSDTGCGMDAATLSMIFEPFFTTKGPGSGTGLGLATVYGIMQQNHGDILVESRRGQGTTFRLYFPVHSAPCEEAPQDAHATGLKGGTATILMVEDEAALLATWQKILGRLGYTVLGSTRPVEALQIAREHPGDIHVLLTDVVMPGMNGRELAEAVMALRPAVKVIYTSGYMPDTVDNHGVPAGGGDFIQKPMDAKTLTDLLASVTA